MRTVTLEVTGMTCGHCVTRVEQAIRGVRGVFSVAVDLDAGQADVDLDEGQASVEQLTGAVIRAGYGAKGPD